MSVCIWFNLSQLLMGNIPSPPLMRTAFCKLSPGFALPRNRNHPKNCFSCVRSFFVQFDIEKFSSFLTLLVSLSRLTSSCYPNTPHSGVIHHSTPHSTPHPTLHSNPLATCHLSMFHSSPLHKSTVSIIYYIYKA